MRTELQWLTTNLLLLDGRPPLLRVYLFGYHVVSMVLLRSRLGPGVDPHHRYRPDRALYITGYMVCCFLLSHRLGRSPLILCRKFCLRHPHVRDVCDIGQMIFWDSKIVWWLTAFMFLLNNTFIQVRYI